MKALFPEPAAIFSFKSAKPMVARLKLMFLVTPSTTYLIRN